MNRDLICVKPLFCGHHTKQFLSNGSFYIDRDRFLDRYLYKRRVNYRPCFYRCLSVHRGGGVHLPGQTTPPPYAPYWNAFLCSEVFPLDLGRDSGFCAHLTLISVSIDVHCDLLDTVFGISFSIGIGVGQRKHAILQDLDTGRDSDSKPDGYIVLCRTCSHCIDLDSDTCSLFLHRIRIQVRDRTHIRIRQYVQAIMTYILYILLNFWAHTPPSGFLHTEQIA